MILTVRRYDSMVCAVIVCLCVCVRHMPVLCQMAKLRITQTMPHDNPQLYDTKDLSRIQTGSSPVGHQMQVGK